MKTLLLIDASALVYRFFHALPPLTAPGGEPIQAIYGLSSVLIKIFKEQRPDYAAAALDRPEKTFREEQFKEYKSHRPPVPEALVFQLQKLGEVFARFGIKTFEQPGFEADDLLGTLVRIFSAEKNLKTVILSGDLDVLQLVKDELVVAQIIKTGVSTTEIYTEAKVVERYGLKPAQLPDYKGLIGDASDNIPGVQGIGPKTARELLQEFGTITGIFESLGIVKSAIAKKLENKQEEALLFKSLAAIKNDVSLEVPDLEELDFREPTKASLGDYFEKLGFASLNNRLEN